jgi:hypothetical protein
MTRRCMILVGQAKEPSYKSVRCECTDGSQYDCKGTGQINVDWYLRGSWTLQLDFAGFAECLSGELGGKRSCQES